MIKRRNIVSNLDYVRRTANERDLLTAALQHRVIAARNDGATVIELAKALGVSRPTVYRILRNTKQD